MLIFIIKFNEYLKKYKNYFFDIKSIHLNVLNKFIFFN